jgi:hypothetical protein
MGRRGALAAILLAGLAGAAMAETAALARKATDAAAIVALAQRQGHVRVIVQFPSPVPAGGTDASGIDERKARIARVRDAIVAAHFGSASDPRPGQGFARGFAPFELTPGFAITVTLPELEALAGDPRVTHIDLDRAMPPAATPQRAR